MASGKAQLLCPSCGTGYGSQSALTSHIRKEHGAAGDKTAELMAKYGESAPRPGGAFRIDRPLRAAPSGVPSVDYVIGVGGIPHGTICEIMGANSSGKTFLALVFAAYSQRNGGLVGFVDAEHKLQPTFAKLPGVDLAAMYYAQPEDGESALNMTRDYVATGLYDVWIVDSVHACVPRKFLNHKEGINAEVPAELAKLMNAGCQVIDHVVARTDTLCIFINHVKTKPMVKYGRTWYTPGGSALEFYASVRLHVKARQPYFDKNNRRIGHQVEVKVEKSSVSAPHAVAHFDLFYTEGEVKINDKDEIKVKRTVVPGVDIASSWFSILKDSGWMRSDGGRHYRTDTGEALGYAQDIYDGLRQADSELLKIASEMTYPEEYMRDRPTQTAA